MSDEPERVFSSSGNLISERRCRLEPDLVEASECIKSWEKAGFCSQIEGTNIPVEAIEKNAELGKPDEDVMDIEFPEIFDLEMEDL